MSIVSKIQSVANKLSVSADMDFNIAEREFANLFTAVKTYQIWIDAPMISNDSVKSNNLMRVYEVKMLFLIKQQLGNTYLQHYDNAISVTRDLVKEFVMRLNAEKDPITQANIFYPITNVKETDTVNQLDENLSGVLVEFNLQEINQGSYCIPDTLPAPLLYFGANKTSVAVGEEVRLTWVATNVNQIEITGIGLVSAIGSTLVTINAQTTYTATATNTAGTATDSITIEIAGVCDDATAVIKDSLGNVLKTENIPSGATEDIGISNSIAVIKDTAGNVLKTEQILAQQTEDIQVGNTTVQLRDSAGNNIGGVNSYLAQSVNNLPAPDGTVTVRNTTPTVLATQAVRSNGTATVTLNDITLTINDQNGNNLSTSSEKAGVNITKVVNVNTALALTIAASTTTPVTNQSINFTGGCTNGTPTNWRWDFGDGTTSTLQNPNKAYVNAGTYTVVLSATDGTNDGYVVFASTITVTLQTIPTTNLQGHYRPLIGASPSNATLVSGAISQWDDAINAYHLTQGSATSRPTYTSNVYTAPNGVVYGGGVFDGINDFLTNASAGFTRGTTSTVYMVLRWNTIAASFQALTCNPAGTTHLLQILSSTQIGYRVNNGTIQDTTIQYPRGIYHVVKMQFNNAGNAQLKFNNFTAYALTNTGTGTSTGINFSIGAAPCPITLLEAFVYNGLISGSDETNIENYLKSRYGLWL